MSVSVGSVTFTRLTAQPFGYDETDTRRGFTAKKWLITGLMTPAEYVSLIGVYDNWRNSKITEDDPVVSNSVGTTVAFSGDGPDSLSWSNVPCWFSTAPQGEQTGAYISCSVELVHAGEALAVLIASQDTTGGGGDDPPDLGTITINGAVLTLRKPPETFQAVPGLELTGGGVSYITGTKKAVEVQDIEGETNQAGWALVRSWFQSTIESTPAVGSWYPISVPTASAEKRIVSGSPTTIYTVSIQRAKVV
jgi:hypothetical protein